MRRERIAVALTLCVLLAGCGGTGGPPGETPKNPQTTVEASTTKTIPDPVYRVELRGRNDEPVQVHVELTGVDNETVYYETTQTLEDGALRDYSSHVRNEGRIRVTVTVANDSLTQVVGPEEDYSIWVQNASSLDVYKLGSG
jgi:major membrane immunogen (membrane-anchored lipoprotein)